MNVKLKLRVMKIIQDNIMKNFIIPAISGSIRKMSLDQEC